MEIKEDICQENLFAEYAEERGLLPEEIDFRITNKQRPKICTEFKSIEESSLGMQDFCDKVVVVTLSDNSRWTMDKEGKALEVAKRIKNWQCGDDIRIDYKLVCKQINSDNTKSVFLLHNVRTSETIPFFDQDAEFLLANVTTSITKVGPSCYTAQTSDGRLWCAGGWFNYFKSIQATHKVIVNKGGSSGKDYFLIDPNYRSIWVTEQKAFRGMGIAPAA